MSQDQKQLILNLLDMVREEIGDMDIAPPKQKADVIIGDLYQAMRHISNWSEGR